MTANSTPSEVFTVVPLSCNNERNLWMETRMPKYRNIYFHLMLKCSAVDDMSE